jgi:hypothetical protein
MIAILGCVISHSVVDHLTYINKKKILRTPDDDRDALYRNFSFINLVKVRETGMNHLVTFSNALVILPLLLVHIERTESCLPILSSGPLDLPSCHDL